MQLTNVIINTVRKEFLRNKILQRGIIYESLVKKLWIYKLAIRSFSCVFERFLIHKLKNIPPGLPSNIFRHMTTLSRSTFKLRKQCCLRSLITKSMFVTISMQHFFNHSVEFILHFSHFCLHLPLNGLYFILNTNYFLFSILILRRILLMNFSKISKFIF